eukprot:m.183668 g.183668  ORF g.183668 m.183668 type:complete len:116 (+) comp18483_c0_seq1:1961-2308(+)
MHYARGTTGQARARVGELPSTMCRGKQPRSGYVAPQVAQVETPFHETWLQHLNNATVTTAVNGSTAKYTAALSNTRFTEWHIQRCVSHIVPRTLRTMACLTASHTASQRSSSSNP